MSCRYFNSTNPHCLIMLVVQQDTNNIGWCYFVQDEPVDTVVDARVLTSGKGVFFRVARDVYQRNGFVVFFFFFL